MKYRGVLKTSYGEKLITAGYNTMKLASKRINYLLYSDTSGTLKFTSATMQYLNEKNNTWYEVVLTDWDDL